MILLALMIVTVLVVAFYDDFYNWIFRRKRQYLRQRGWTVICLSGEYHGRETRVSKGQFYFSDIVPMDEPPGCYPMRPLNQAIEIEKRKVRNNRISSCTCTD